MQPIEVYGGPATGKVTGHAVAKGDGTGELGGFKVILSIRGRAVTFKVEGLLSTEKDYRMDFSTSFTGGDRVVPGFQHINVVIFVEAGHTIPAVICSHFESFKVIATYKQGSDGFEVSKNIRGNVVPPRGQRFDIIANYALPAGTTAANYPDRGAPENPMKLIVTIGNTTPYMPTSPKGMVVILSEDASSVDPMILGIVWGAPVFLSISNKVSTSGDKTQAIFATEGQVAPPILLMNTTEASPNGAFAISKTVVGGGSTGTDTFSVNYRCSAVGEGGVAAKGAVDVSAGAKKVVGRFPAGITCEMISKDETATARAGYSLAVDKG